ncbi:glycoside hydrolase family 88 protein [Exidia glandulosa HHB12029]|uniref:Glycoside hydrolase family 88 protein n=1 Tax=Exidia glandulosa HHB12029 TaxID=1314781 RepID=A0A165HLW8_EXIGL|nr:glycoside hydrolase family 88 protein [Exidia glandulosa HHB12029]
MLSARTAVAAVLAAAAFARAATTENLNLGSKLPAELFDPLVAKKVLAMAQSSFSPPAYPSITSTSGVWQWGSPDNWITGFFPSTLYQLAKRECLCPGSTAVDGAVPDWLELGRTWSGAIPSLHWHNGQGHDVGFISWPFAEELGLFPKNQTARDNIIEFALELSSRYAKEVGCTRSWDWSSSTSPTPATDFLVIIDNLMNLETLLQAYDFTKNKTFYDVAIDHADTTLKNHFRDDWGSWHVVNYDHLTGEVKEKYTQQGYSDDSTWTRGEAWGLHGYSKLYQYTKKPRYLDAARNIAKYYLRRTPKAYLPWDFDAPKEPMPPADASAAMIAAAGFQLLAQIEKSQWNLIGAAQWDNAAHMLISQTASYAWNPSWQSVLSNSTRDNHGIPHSNNTGLPYADYYWVKNGNYLLASGQLRCPNGKRASASRCGIDLTGPTF